MSKIDHIGNLTPNAVLAKYLEKIDEIESIVLFVTFKEDRDNETSWSTQKLGDVAYAIVCIELLLHEEIRDETFS